MRQAGRVSLVNLKTTSTLEGVFEESPHLFPAGIDIREDYGIMRSLRRGVTVHAKNVEFPTELVETINRWRAEYHSDNPSVKTHVKYTQLNYATPQLRFSLKL